MDNDKDKKPKDQNLDGDGKGDQNKGGNAGDQNNDGGDKGDTMIPKTRLDEEIKKRKDLEKWKADQEAKAQEAEQKQLEEQGKFKELAEAEKKKREELETKYNRTAKENALKLEAIKAGTVDADAVVALTNLDSIILSEDGSIDTKSVLAVIEDLKKSKAYLFGEGGNSSVNIGNNGGAPNGGGNSTTPYFRRSQLRDSKFYAEHEADILKAVRENRIIDDIQPAPKKK